MASDPDATVVLGWGSFSGTFGSTKVPAENQLPAGVHATTMAGGSSYSLALGSDGAVYAWGYNDHGQLGTGQGNFSRALQPTPERVLLPDGVSATAIGTSHQNQSFAVGSDGAAYYWGAQDSCHSGADVTVPVTLPLPAGVHARQVVGGVDAVYVLGGDGNVYATGSNVSGALGTGTTASADCTPTRVALPAGVTASAIAPGYYFAFASGSDGRLYAWGANSQHTLGNGFSTADQATPVPVLLPDGVTPTAVAAGLDHALAVGSDGQLYSWGANSQGQLGTSAGYTYVAAGPEQVVLPGGVAPTMIAATNSDSFAVGSDGNLYAWGSNNTGQLDGGTTAINSRWPVRAQLPIGSPVTAVAAGPGFGQAVMRPLAPQFTQASPPSTATAGSTLDYTFAASWYPTYTLAAGAPAWLSINSTTGTLTGTLPPDASTFSYSVIATNAVGSATAGPFTVTVPIRPVDVSGTVIDDAGNPVPGAVVDVCAPSGSVCQHTASNGTGDFTATSAPNSVVVVTAYPPAGPGTVPGSTGELAVPSTGLSGLALKVTSMVGLGVGVTVASGQVASTAGGQPVLNWGQTTGLQVASCVHGTGLVSVVGQNSFTGSFEFHTYPLTEDPAGSGSYTATLPPQLPIHGPVTIKRTVTCASEIGLQPQYGLSSGGENVAISGTGLDTATAVSFGAAPATDLQSVSDGLLTVTAPPGTGTVPVVVTLASGASLTVAHYTYVPAADLPSLDLARYRQATAGPGTAPIVPPDTPTATPTAASLRSASAAIATRQADDTTISSNSSVLAELALWLYNHIPGDAATTLRTAVTSVLAALNPTCDHDRTSLKASVHLLVGVAVGALVVNLSPVLTLVAEGLLDGLVSPLGALLLAPVLPWLVKAAVGYVVNKIVDAVIDAGIDAAMGKCGQQPANALIDPSGAVLDTNGNPLTEATVTILRSDSETGPFTPVDVTQPGIEPATNPETTAADGAFHWDVRSGYYEVQATRTGCTAPDRPDQDTATTGPMPVPPPQVGLTITLQCPDEPPAPTPAVTSLDTTTGPPGGGTDVIVSGSGFVPGATVTIGGVGAAELTYLGPSALKITTPAHTIGASDVVVRTPGGESATSAADRFTYGTTPAITGLSVSQGTIAGGTVVTVTGSGFTGATLVGFGGVPGTELTVKSDTQLTVATPAVSAAGVVKVEVLTPFGVNPAGAPATFTYTDASAAKAPICSPVGVTTEVNDAVTVDLSCTGDGVIYDQPAQPRHGTMSAVNPTTGAVTYTPRHGYTGTDTFTYTAHNAAGTSMSATVTVTVTAKDTGGQDGNSQGGNDQGGSPQGGDHQDDDSQGGSPTATLNTVTVPAGGTVRVTGTGFAPRETVQAVLHSAPVSLGTNTADEHGRVQFIATIPTGTPAGDHHITLTGTRSAGIATAALTIVDPTTGLQPASGSTPSKLANTGTNLQAELSWALLALLLGYGLILVANTTRRAAGHRGDGGARRGS